MKDSFVFYSSYADAILQLDSAESQMNVLKALFNFAFREVEPLDGSLNKIENIIFSMARPTIEASKRNYENGKKGGRPKKTPLKTPLLTNDNVNVNVNENVKDNVNETVNVNANENVKENLNNYNLNSIPTLEEINDFAKSQNLKLDTQEFFDYYEATEWQNVYNWRKLLIRWEERQLERKRKDYAINPYAKIMQ